MLKDIEVTTSRRLEVIPKNIVVALNDDASAPMYLTLPPIEELRAIRELAEIQISVNEVVADTSENIREHYLSELKQLDQKHRKFSGSVTYLNHLANLAELAGDFALGEKHLRSALAVTSSRFSAHRLEANLLRQQKLGDLEASISRREFDVDYETFLHLAYTTVLRNKYDQAFAHITRALERDPVDFRGRMLAGALYLHRREFEKAIQNFRIASEEKTTSSALFVNMAVAYFCLGDITKALTAARRAISINPLDQNAVAFYADITFHEERSAEAIPCLEKFARYEQKIPTIWTRLARAYYFSERLDDALVALRHEAAIKDSPGVWNNMGVVYVKKRDSKRALQYYSHAIRDDAYKTNESAQLALSNLLLLLSEQGFYAEVIKIAAPIIESGLAENLAKKKQVDGIFLAYLKALTRSERRDHAVEIANRWLRYAEISTQLKVQLVAHLLAHYSLFEPNREMALRYSRLALRGLTGCNDCDPKRRSLLINNIAFAFIEFGQLDGAASVLPMLSKAVHIDSYSTATLGLYHLRKGNIGRGESLYKVAIAIAVDSVAKKAIRQKMNLELGKICLQSGDHRAARKLLERAAHAKKDSVLPLQKQANMLLRTLGNAR